MSNLLNQKEEQSIDRLAREIIQATIKDSASIRVEWEAATKEIVKVFINSGQGTICPTPPFNAKGIVGATYTWNARNPDEITASTQITNGGPITAKNYQIATRPNDNTPIVGQTACLNPT